MKYLPLIRAGLTRKPVHPILTAMAMMFAACLAGLSLVMARVLPRSEELDLAVRAISGGGFLLILFLTAYAVSESVRQRGWEFALLRVLGFPGGLVAALFFLEIVSACLVGAVLGLSLAQLIFSLVYRLLFKGAVAPFLPLSVVGLDLAAALLVASASTALPAWRLARVNLAAALSRGPQ